MSVDYSHLNGGGNPGFGIMDRLIGGIKDNTKSAKEKASRLEEFHQHAQWQSSENQLNREHSSSEAAVQREHQKNMLHEGVKASNAVNNSTVATHGLNVGADGSVSHTTTTRAPKKSKSVSGTVANRAKASARVPKDTRPTIPLSAPDTEVRPGVDAKPEPKARSPRAKGTSSPKTPKTPNLPAAKNVGFSSPPAEPPVAGPKTRTSKPLSLRDEDKMSASFNRPKTP